jgi:hypothetical protein
VIEMPTGPHFTPENRACWWEIMGKIPKKFLPLERHHELWLELLVRIMTAWRHGEEGGNADLNEMLPLIGLKLTDFKRQK